MELIRRCKQCGEVKLLEEFRPRYGDLGRWRHKCTLCWKAELRKPEGSRAPRPKKPRVVVTHKVCAKCKVDKDAAAFHKEPRRNLDGLQSYCKECLSTAGSVYRQSPAGRAYHQARNKSAAGRASTKKYRQSEKFKKTITAWEQSERGAEVRTRWNKSEKGRAYNQYYKDRPETKAQRLATHRERYRNDPSYKIAWLFRIRILHCLKGREKKGSAVTMLGCDPVVAVDHISKQFAPGMSWENHGQWHIDHIKPLASFDLTDPAQMAIAFHYTNLQPLWAFDNISKGAKV